MGPGFVRRDVLDPAADDLLDNAASMGPGFVRRDVRYATAADEAQQAGFNGARLRSPGCAAPAQGPRSPTVMLQWGPASFAGMCTRHRSTHPGQRKRFNGARLRSPGCAADRSMASCDAVLLQWGPASFAGMCHVHPQCVPSVRVELQWGPASFAGMCLQHRADEEAAGHRFNGARLRSPGCAQIEFAKLNIEGMLQWGPASFAGMCGTRCHPINGFHALQWGPASFAGMCRRATRQGRH